MSEETVNTQETGESQQENQSADDSFKAITTQEDFDRAIKARLAREKATNLKAFQEEYADTFEKAKRFEEIEEENKSEIAKATERAEKAEAQIKQFEHEKELAQWAKEAAEEFGVDDRLIRGNTLDEMKAHAEALKEAIGDKARYAPTPSTGKPAQTSGAISDDMDDKLRKVAGLKEKG